ALPALRPRLSQRSHRAAAPALPGGDDTDPGVGRLRPCRRVRDAGAHPRGHGRARPRHRRRLSARDAGGAGAGAHRLVRPGAARLSQARVCGRRAVGRHAALPGARGALLGYRLPAFIALNEPETSLHPELLEPLARMIVGAAERTQIWVVTHSERLAQAFIAAGAVAPRTGIKRDGATWIEGSKLGAR